MDAIRVCHIGFDNLNNYMVQQLICSCKHNQSSYKWQLVTKWLVVNDMISSSVWMSKLLTLYSKKCDYIASGTTHRSCDAGIQKSMWFIQFVFNNHKLMLVYLKNQWFLSSMKV